MDRRRAGTRAGGHRPVRTANTLTDDPSPVVKTTFPTHESALIGSWWLKTTAPRTGKCPGRKVAILLGVHDGASAEMLSPRYPEASIDGKRRVPHSQIVESVGRLVLSSWGRMPLLFWQAREGLDRKLLPFFLGQMVFLPGRPLPLEGPLHPHQDSSLVPKSPEGC